MNARRAAELALSFAAAAARGAGRGAAAGGRLALRGGAILARATGKLIATVWRLAGALDAALWRGVKVAGGALARMLAAAGRVAARALGDFVRWLPTRAGRAYSAFSGIVLIVASLWILDELRVEPSSRLVSGGERRPPVDAEDPILARIDGRYVHLSEVEAAARLSGFLRDGETLTLEAAFERKLVETYVEQRLLARAAIDEGVQRTPQLTRRLNAARERILAAAYLQARLDAAVTDDAVRRLYDSQKDVTRIGDEVRARHIVVRSEEEIASVRAALEAGGDFAALARAISTDEATAPLGGELGWFSREVMGATVLPPALVAIAFATPRGERAAPFETAQGWHILEVQDRRASAGVPLDPIRDNIRRFLTMRTIETTLARLRDEADVVYYAPETGPPAEQAAAVRRGAGGS